MKKVYLMNLLLIILLISTLSGCKKSVNYTPETREELRALVDNDTVKISSSKTSKITDMSKVFANVKRTDFSGIENWDTSKVTNMEAMFLGAVTFNSDISKWNVSKVKNMSDMFVNAESFNQDISSWNVSNVANMSTMFANALSFNKDLSKWKVADNVTKEGAFWGSPLENNPPTWFNKK